MLYKPNNTPNNAKIAHKHLIDFVDGTQKLYGTSCMTPKTHALLHLSECFLDFGPLQEFSCMKPEGLNSCMVKNVFGTQGYISQVVSRFVNYTILNNIIDCVRDSEDRPVSEDTMIGRLLIKCKAIETNGESKRWK